MTYIDGFVAPVLAGRRDAYRQLAEEASAVFVECGALHVVEAIGNDVPHGQVTDLWRAVAAEEGEDVAFSWIVWPSKAARDAGWEKAMADPRMKPPGEMPFDGKRLIFGGFDVIVDIAAPVAG
ncbi:DUF1428 domain-containing protein [Sphingomonas nostoxanthinifaciens]|uniref:DUF1428 domain-containing protein n=1 Tax=Sphingomonas nostoxanthinifaciens TaxID=2872652 RepID=UPI001CC202AB|nr:DUF1428 domain-containing protein [Sphingomonas nostoxanthinifaciens]UAK24462.1 DUF1428 domain-containing protein [Sphingomonas nostoxanthinifaciens]